MNSISDKHIISQSFALQTLNQTVGSINDTMNGSIQSEESFSFKQSLIKEDKNNPECMLQQQEQYPPVFCYLNDNHTSVIGMRDHIYQNSKCSIYSIHE